MEHVSIMFVFMMAYAMWRTEMLSVLVGVTILVAIVRVPLALALRGLILSL